MKKTLQERFSELEGSLPIRIKRDVKEVFDAILSLGVGENLYYADIVSKLEREKYHLASCYGYCSRVENALHVLMKAKIVKRHEHGYYYIKQ